jgi:hypothetical protein
LRGFGCQWGKLAAATSTGKGLKFWDVHLIRQLLPVITNFVALYESVKMSTSNGNPSNWWIFIRRCWIKHFGIKTLWWFPCRRLTETTPYFAILMTVTEVLDNF